MAHHGRRRRVKLNQRQEQRREYLAKKQLSRCGNPALATVVERNMDAIDAHRQESEAAKGIHEHIADKITDFSGSMTFVYLHVVIFMFWIGVNLDLSPIPKFDPYPFGMLTTIVSLEAIFLSTFVLVSQNRQAEIADRRAELDLQINLLTEYEVTRILTLVDRLATDAGISDCKDSELQELEKDVAPEAVLKNLEDRGKKPK